MFRIFISLFILLINTLLFADTPMQLNTPISAFTDFTCNSKTSAAVSVDIHLDENLFSDSVFINQIISEFNEAKSHVLYQSRLIAVPSQMNNRIKVVKVDSIIYHLADPSRIIEISSQSHPTLAYLGDIGKMRDITVAPLIVCQYRYDKSLQSIIGYTNIEVEVDFGSQLHPLDEKNPVSQSWSKLYKSTILNFDEDNTLAYNRGLPQGYLIIVADALYNSILPLAQWKNQKGWNVTIKRTSEIGTTANDFRNYIQQAYNTFSPKLEYVLLVGSANLIPPVAVYAIGDHMYSCVDGNDLYPDIFIGRLPSANTSELGVMVAKIIGYEQVPWLTDTLWYRRALTVGTSYQASGVPVWTALATLRWVRSHLLQHNYLRVDTVFDPPYSNGVGIIDTIINSGVTYVCGRGWGNREGWDRPNFKIANVYALNNGWKLPVITSFYCATGNYNAYPTRCFGEAWLIAGTPTVPKGAIAFYGPTYPITSTRYNNCQSYHVYWGIFEDRIFNAGPAVFNGKVAMLNNFPLPSDSEQLRAHVVSYNLLGDPALEMWGEEVPKSMNVTYPSQLPVGSSQITITVKNSNNLPISNALVALVKNNEVKLNSFTNTLGIASFNFSTQSQDTLFVTVTKHNFIPHRGNVQIQTSPLFVGYYNHSGNIIAGQSDDLNITLKNYGTSQTATNTSAILRTNDIYLNIIDSVKTYGDIPSNQTQTANPFQFSVAPNCTNNHKINFQLAITSGANNWLAGFNCSVRAAALSYKNHIVADGNNGVLEPSETGNIFVKIYNRGVENINNVTAILRSSNPYAIQVLDSIGYFGTVNIGDTIQNTADYFTLHASSSIAIGRKFYLQLILRNPTYEHIEEFPIIIGNISPSTPLGPDNYGYWAYDNTDIGYSECPTYAWVEIDPNYGGSGTRLTLSNHSIKRVNLPFTFKYYGRNYNRISIASNGYMAMDSSWIIDPYNWQIPSPMGPPAMIAPFWDDFNPETLSSSGVYYHHDAVNNRFIIQWSRIHHIHGFRDPYPAELQTFQVILHNPLYYPTRTGDGPILFQYHTVVNDDSFPVDCHNYATVGIESHSLEDGIEYTFADSYPPAAAVIQNGRAIKYTTNNPDTFTAISETHNNHLVLKKTLHAYPNPLNKQTRFNYSLSSPGAVSLRIYDINGNLIDKPFDNIEQAPGYHQYHWQRKDIPAGIYFCILSINNYRKTEYQKIKIIIN